MADRLRSGQAVHVTESPQAVSHQHEIEVILFKQVASYLATPIFVVDPAGTLAYYNEPAEQLLGCRYDETGAMPMSEWSTIFVPRDEQGDPLPGDALPLALALEHHEPAHGDMWITGEDRKSVV